MIIQSDKVRAILRFVPGGWGVCPLHGLIPHCPGVAMALEDDFPEPWLYSTNKSLAPRAQEVADLERQYYARTVAQMRSKEVRSSSGISRPTQGGDE